ncbi:uncharacterized protein N7529_001710 [Penicillium soppii]|uniref:uncharacterized protein n=1 Tax=Penicillium soppii TaxID=69789 RepID=UPI002547F2BD|nr:uncharacterized protein N7529_001710 [Penicillium soppii]KAJ5876126.1 hypothetical protein N7529_001710 [Penicillium soppii]
MLTLTSSHFTSHQTPAIKPSAIHYLTKNRGRPRHNPLPPPPITGYLTSGTGNASADDAERAHDFCNQIPLWLPTIPSDAVYHSVQIHDLRPVHPRELNGEVQAVSCGRWKARSHDANTDCVVLSQLPVYFAMKDSPLVTEVKKTIYFEVKVEELRGGLGGDPAGISLGFVAQPYPSWRSPGWERGGLGVFSDDGCRFVNDSYGGKDFTRPIQVGETVGIGMRFEIGYSNKDKCNVDVFFTRQGVEQSGWNLHEEVDGEDGGVEGLEGDYDLYAAVGLFGGVKFEACFDPAGWLWRPQ